MIAQKPQSRKNSQRIKRTVATIITIASASALVIQFMGKYEGAWMMFSFFILIVLPILLGAFVGLLLIVWPILRAITGRKNSAGKLLVRQIRER